MDVVDWLLDADPSIRWQVMRDLTHEPERVVAAERARVATEGWGARLLALQGDDGRWAGSAWSHDWTDTMHTLELLRLLGLDPRARRPGGRSSSCGTTSPGRAGTRRTSGPATRSSRARSSRASTASSSRSARTSARTSAPRWTGCSASSSPTAAGTARPRTARRCRRSGPRSASSKACWRSSRRWAARREVRAARLRGQEYLLERRLFRRKSTGEVIDVDWLRFAFPTWHYYDVLRGLDYLREAGAEPDPRIAEAIDVVERNRGPTADGRSSGSTRARRISTSTTARASRAAGTRSGACGCSTGPGPAVALFRPPVEPHGGRGMIEQIAAREFREQAGVEDWRVVGDGACTYVPNRVVRGGRPAGAGDRRAGRARGPPARRRPAARRRDRAARRDRRRLLRA